MTRDDFEFFAALVRERSGIALTADKSYLVESRMTPLARREGFDSLSALAASMREETDEKLAWALTEAMTTSETYFFRDRTPFDRFTADVLPSLRAARAAGERVRVWCAGCSTGQEAYSLAMLIDALRPQLNGATPEIVATDICARALEKAKSGLFSQFEVQRGLPIGDLVAFFEQDGDMWRVSGRLRALVEFKRFNLMDDAAALGRFDVVFCRNVLRYFDAATQAGVLGRIAAQCSDDAFLFLGANESLSDISDAFEPSPVVRGLYRRAGAVARNQRAAAAS